MEYLLGSPNDFHNFVNSISNEDKIGIITHTDADGLTAGIFLKKILESKNIKPQFIEFLNYGAGVLKEFSEKHNYDKLFFTDWNADNYENGLELLREKGDVLIFDHHPLNESLENKNNILKTEGKYCSSHALFDLSKNYFDTKNIEWLVCSAIIADYTFTEEENFNFIKSIYPEVDKEKMFESIPGKNAITISNAIIYHKPDFRKVFDLIENKDLEKLKKVSEEVEKVAEESTKEYLKTVKYYPEKKFHFGYFTPKMRIVSKIISKISHENPDKIYIMASDNSDKKDFIKLSGRAQNGEINLGEILKKCTKDFEDASAGGHPQAAAASFPKKYLEEFKERILKEL